MKQFGNHVGRLVFLFLVFSSGMFISSSGRYNVIIIIIIVIIIIIIITHILLVHVILISSVAQMFLNHLKFIYKSA